MKLFPLRSEDGAHGCTLPSEEYLVHKRRRVTRCVIFYSTPVAQDCYERA